MEAEDQILNSFQNLHWKEWEKLARETDFHNDTLIKSFGATAEKDFEELLDGCAIPECGKIEVVEKPKGNRQHENCGIFKNVYVDQWSVGDSGDSFEGNIYARVEKKWYKIPYYC